MLYFDTSIPYDRRINQVFGLSLSLWDAGELVGLEDSPEPSLNESEDLGHTDCSQDSPAVRFVNILMELGADKLFKE